MCVVTMVTEDVAEDEKALQKEAADLRIKTHEYRDKSRSLQRELGQKNMDLEAVSHPRSTDTSRLILHSH